jgi:WD40 repeat protein
MLQSTIFEEIEPAKKKGYTIFHGLKSAICAIAVHPKRSILAIAGAEGFVLLWDYVKKGEPIFHNYEFYPKEEIKNKEKREQVFTTMTFTPDGEELLIGQHNGLIQVMDPNTGYYKKLTTQLRTTENKQCPITGLIVSNDG